MKKLTVISLLAFLVLSLACQTLLPTPLPPRDGTVITTCADITKAFRSLQPVDIPQGLLETGVKQGDEFDVNSYFDVLTNISMQDGFALDYTYLGDPLGAFPLLAARPVDQPPYTSATDVPEDSELRGYWKYIQINDSELGYFEYVALLLMANQFYLSWHANYNDIQIVCNSADVNTIVDERNTGDFGMEFDSEQMRQIRAMQNIEPLVKLTDTTVSVEIITFTKWGGFYRMTYTINRDFPHEVIDRQDENIVPYDCGIMF